MTLVVLYKYTNNVDKTTGTSTDHNTYSNITNCGIKIIF